MKKGFYIGSIAGAGIFGTVLREVATMRIQAGALDVGPLFFLLSIVLLIYGAVVALIMWAKAWKAIQDGHARTTAAKAIGFLFIPVFNLYWCFQAFWGFAKDHNSYIGRHGISGAELPSGLFLAYSIFCVVSIVVGVIPTSEIQAMRLIFTLITLFTLAIIANKICDAVNNISEKALLDAKMADKANVERDLNALAKLYRDVGKHAEAERLERRARKIVSDQED